MEFTHITGFSQCYDSFKSTSVPGNKVLYLQIGLELCQSELCISPYFQSSQHLVCGSAFWNLGFGYESGFSVLSGLFGFNWINLLAYGIDL